MIATPAATNVATSYLESRDAAMESNKMQEQQERFDRYEAALERVYEMDPSSPEYRDAYEKLKSRRDIDPEGFDLLPAPVQGRHAEEKPASKNSEPSSGWGRFTPNGWEGAATGGLGGAGIGALLGLLFGGKGGMWKLGLLGALLGSLHGSGALQQAWNSIRNT